MTFRRRLSLRPAGTDVLRLWKQFAGRTDSAVACKVRLRDGTQEERGDGREPYSQIYDIRKPIQQRGCISRNPNS